MAELRVDIEKLEEDYHEMLNALKAISDTQEKNRVNALQLFQWTGPASENWKGAFRNTDAMLTAKVKEAERIAGQIEVALYFYKQAEDSIRSKIEAVH